jgi:hypothetical protein
LIQYSTGGEKIVDGTDRVVLVAAGFGVWQAGRHLASARWTDVVRVRALRRDGETEPPVLALKLRDGTEVLVQATLPGFGSFLDAAEKALPGMSGRTVLIAGTGKSDIIQTETILFERYPSAV